MKVAAQNARSKLHFIEENHHVNWTLSKLCFQGLERSNARNIHRCSALACTFWCGSMASALISRSTSTHTHTQVGLDKVPPPRRPLRCWRRIWWSRISGKKRCLRLEILENVVSLKTMDWVNENPVLSTTGSSLDQYWLWSFVADFLSNKLKLVSFLHGNFKIILDNI